MAEYVLAHQFRAATMTIDEFAAAVGVSGKQIYTNVRYDPTPPNR
jgi:hypothetical protein